MPYVFAHPGLTGTLRPSGPRAVQARRRAYCYDTMTLIGPGTWRAARAAVDAALTAVDLVVAGAPVATRSAGLRVTTRPGPRTAVRATSTTRLSRRSRFATPASSGSPSSTSTPTTATAPRRSSRSAATSLRRPSTSTPRPAGSRTSLGLADERGAGAGAGDNRQRPARTGVRRRRLARRRRVLALRAATAPALVVSARRGRRRGDPESPLQVTHAGYLAAGGMLAALDLPTVACRRAATTSRRSAASSSRRSAGSTAHGRPIDSTVPETVSPGCCPPAIAQTLPP